MKTKLSERIRPDSEAAPWVIEEVRGLEGRIEYMQESIDLMQERIEEMRKDAEDYSRLTEQARSWD